MSPRERCREMARRFATLRTLDQKPLDPSIAFAVGQDRANGVVDSPGLSSRVKSEKAKAAKREAVVFPLPISGGFFESDGARDFVGQFFIKCVQSMLQEPFHGLTQTPCRRFFEAFDNDRPALLAAYAPVCTFSFHADTAHPARARAKKVGSHGDKRYPHQHKLDWKPYLTAEGSRNLMRVKNPGKRWPQSPHFGTPSDLHCDAEKRVKTLQVSPAGVIASIAQLPKTKHPLDDSAKFIWDSWTMPNFLAPEAPGSEGETVIFASLHGEFSESECRLAYVLEKLCSDLDFPQSRARAFARSTATSSSRLHHLARRMFPSVSAKGKSLLTCASCPAEHKLQDGLASSCRTH